MNPVKKNLTDERIAEFKAPIVERRFSAYKIKVSIQLRLNMKEAMHQTLFQLMEELESEVGNFNRSVSTAPSHTIREKVKLILEKISLTSREILKEEWERVKNDAFSMN